TDGGGLNRVKRQVFEILPESRGLVVQSVCEDSQGGLWIGSNGGEVGHWANGRVSWFGPNEGLMFHVPVKAVVSDQTDRIWVGTWPNVGPGLFQFANGRFQRLVAQGIPSVVRAIHQDRKGHLWLGTRGQGL